MIFKKNIRLTLKKLRFLYEFKKNNLTIKGIKIRLSSIEVSTITLILGNIKITAKRFTFQIKPTSKTIFCFSTNSLIFDLNKREAGSETSNPHHNHYDKINGIITKIQRIIDHKYIKRMIFAKSINIEIKNIELSSFLVIHNFVKCSRTRQIRFIINNFKNRVLDIEAIFGLNKMSISILKKKKLLFRIDNFQKSDRSSSTLYYILSEITIESSPICSHSLFLPSLEIEQKNDITPDFLKFNFLFKIQALYLSFYIQIDKSSQLHFQFNGHNVEPQTLHTLGIFEEYLSQIFQNMTGSVNYFSFNCQLDLATKQIVQHQSSISHSLSITGEFQDYLRQDFLERKNIQQSHLAPNLIKFKLDFKIEELIIKSEDPNFWNHNGFDFKLFLYSLLVNINDNKYSRGASTITMQLIRNLYLYYDKNLIRKINEIILTLIFENLVKLDKKDILNKYLNIIELAPNTYGIAEGSKFYFQREYSDLCIEEWIIILYILPRPKHFLDALNNDSPQLKTNFLKHVNFIRQKFQGIELRNSTIIMGKQLYFV